MMIFILVGRLADPGTTFQVCFVPITGRMKHCHSTARDVCFLAQWRAKQTTVLLPLVCQFDTKLNQSCCGCILIYIGTSVCLFSPQFWIHYIQHYVHEHVSLTLVNVFAGRRARFLILTI